MCVIKDPIFAMYRVSFLILCLVGASLQVSISEFAVPSSIKLGENAELQCHYQLTRGENMLLYVKWWWTPLGAGSDGRRSVYQRVQRQPPQLLQHFDNIEILGNDTLLLKALQPKHSGTYECEVSANYNEARKHTDMVVYTAGTGPSMNISEVVDGPDEDEDNDVSVSCEARGVAPRPDLVITLNGEEINGSEEVVTILPDGLFDIATNVTLSTPAAGAVIRCELFYTDANVTHEAFFIDHAYEDLGATTEPAPAAEESAAPVDSTTEQPGNAGVAWGFAWALLAPAASLALLASSV